ncbi:uncharacterized protein LOC141622365 [Silene latifolia]|uniref:uncharacterized protein LOC141622365 n=1 Tax=Silene latifolia TaxID=37657 RepID=UPI003D787ECC
MSGDADPPPLKIDSSSPYYIGNHDKPGDRLTDIRLNLHNFDEWAHAVRTALRARRKFGFLDGTFTEPKPPCTKDDWETIHSMLVSWLMNIIDPEVRCLLSKYEDAKRLWDDLHDRFDIIDGPRIQHIKGALRDCRQTETMSIAVYYGTLNQLWDELDKYEPIICCKCDANVGKQHLERRESDRLHQFLLGLLSPYDTLRSVILSQSPLPTVGRAFQLISQEERVKGLHKTTELAPHAEVATFALRQNNPRPGIDRPSSQLSRSERQKLVCSNCNKKGHDRSMCFDLMEVLPDWWYELRGQKPPGHGGSGASRGGYVPKGRGGGTGTSRTGQPRTDSASGSKTESSNAIHTNSKVEESSQPPVTVYGTPSHTFSGPMYENGDWQG